MKQIFQNDLPEWVKAFDADDRFVLSITQTPSNYWPTLHKTQNAVYTLKQAQKILRWWKVLRAFLIAATALVAALVFLNTGDVFITLIAAAVVTFIARMSFKSSEAKLREKSHRFGSGAYDITVTISKNGNTVGCSMPELYIRGDEDLDFYSYDPFKPTSAPIDKEALFVCDLGTERGRMIEYRNGLRQTHVAFALIIWRPPLGSESFKPHHGEMVTAVLNEMLDQVREQTSTAEDDIQVNPMD